MAYVDHRFNRGLWHVAAAIAVLPCLMLLAGCCATGCGCGDADGTAIAATQPAGQHTPVVLTGDQGVEPLESAFPLSERLQPKRRAGAYLVTEGARSGTAYEFTVSEEGETWLIDFPEYHASRRKFDASGDILILREDDEQEGVKVLYTPPIRIPAKLEPGQVYRGKCKIRIVYKKSGRTREKGDVRYEVRLIGRKRLTTPAGTFDAVLVRQTRFLDLTLADVTVEITDAVAEGWGIVANRVDQTISAVGGLYSRKSAEQIERLR